MILEHGKDKNVVRAILLLIKVEFAQWYSYCRFPEGAFLRDDPGQDHSGQDQ